MARFTLKLVILYNKIRHIFMVVEALWNRVFEMALVSTIVSDFFMPRDHA